MLPCPKVTPAPSLQPAGAEAGQLRVDHVAEAAFEGRIGNVKLWDRSLAYTPDDKRVVVCDLRTGRIATVARLDDGSPGVVTMAVGSRSTVAYLELSTVPNVDVSGKGGRAEWTVSWADLRSGRRGVVARSAGKGGVGTRRELLPRPRLDWPWLVWLEGVGPDTDAPSTKLHVHDLRTHRTRVVGEFSGTRNAALTDGTIVYDRPTGSAGEEERRDLFAVRADGSGEARQLTHGGNVHSFWAANGRVVWQEPPAPDGASAVWTVPVDGDDEAVEVGRGRFPVPGQELVAADTVGQLALFDLVHPATPPVPARAPAGSGSLDLSSYWSVSGDLLVWVTNDHPPGPELPRHLHVARLARDGPRAR